MGNKNIYIEFIGFSCIGKTYLRLFNSLTKLYLKANQTNNENDLINIEREVSNIEDEFYRERFSKQVYLSDWVAHYKFFFQYQSDWVVKELDLKLFKDKIPIQKQKNVKNKVL